VAAYAARNGSSSQQSRDGSISRVELLRAGDTEREMKEAPLQFSRNATRLLLRAVVLILLLSLALVAASQMLKLPYRALAQSNVESSTSMLRW